MFRCRSIIQCQSFPPNSMAATVRHLSESIQYVAAIIDRLLRIGVELMSSTVYFDALLIDTDPISNLAADCSTFRFISDVLSPSAEAPVDGMHISRSPVFKSSKRFHCHLLCNSTFPFVLRTCYPSRMVLFLAFNGKLWIAEHRSNGTVPTCLYSTLHIFVHSKSETRR